MKTLLIISGISGSGKSALAETLKWMMQTPDDSAIESEKRCEICTADDFFMVDNEYKFNPAKLGEAHTQCRSKFNSAIGQGVELVILANTTTETKHANPYINYAEQNGYTVSWLMVVPHHSGQNQHNVPSSTVSRQAKQLVNTFTEMHRKFHD